MGLINTIVVVLVVLWLAGFAFHVAGGFIHLLLVIALVVFLLRFIRRETV
ncbi:MAG TPA: lmo0937 family membrane protein [Candidatus Saccharimonadales bacterium]|nr:lmo0937 family membrane protein [Candidatus Saccharimonadales bacterium]